MDGTASLINPTRLERFVIIKAQADSLNNRSCWLLESLDKNSRAFAHPSNSIFRTKTVGDTIWWQWSGAQRY
jgi:hypothetical protein